jgi:proline iminopeptidase
LNNEGQRVRIQIEPGVRLFVDVEGPGLVPDGNGVREKPTLVLLHGGPGFDHVAFKPVFSRLADLAQIVYYDHRGHGMSDRRPPSEWTLDTWADDLVRLCDALGIVKPIVLGQSFGGFVAQRYIARHPAHASKVILSSTAGSMAMPRKLAMFEQLGGAEARAVAERFWADPNDENNAVYQRVCKPLYNPSLVGRVESAPWRFTAPEILQAFIRGEQRQMNLLPGLAAAQCPVLVLAGELDPVCPLEDAQDIAAALPARWRHFHSFPGIGHGAWREKPNEAFDVLRRFITEPA